MAKKFTDEEIAELERLGSVKYDPETHNIARFGELIDKLSELISMNSARVQADLARSQSQLEVLGTIQKMVRNQPKGVTKSHEIDLAPLQDVLAQILAANAEKAKQAYQFNVQRVEGGLMTGITAVPITPTSH